MCCCRRMRPTRLSGALYPRLLEPPFPEPPLWSQAITSSPHVGGLVVLVVEGLHSYVPTVLSGALPNSRRPPWSPCSSPPVLEPSLWAYPYLVFISCVILVGRILYYYHRFLLKYTLFWYHGGIRINNSPLTTSRTCRCQDRGTTSCCLLHSHLFIVLLKFLRKIDISWWIQKKYEPEPTEYIKKIMIQVLCHSLKRNLLTSQDE